MPRTGRGLSLIILAATVFTISCASMFNKIDNVTVFQQAAPYNGPVQIRLGNGNVKSTVLFEMRIVKNEYGGMPRGEFLDEIKREAAKLGANVLIFKCGEAGTTGQRICIAHGYRE